MLLNMEIEGLPPTVNHMYRMHGRYKYKTSEAKEYQDRVAEQMRSEYGNNPVYRGRVSLAIAFFTNNRKRWDIDNRVKALQDCLSMAGVIADDKQIDELRVSRIYTKWDKTVTRLKLVEVLSNELR